MGPMAYLTFMTATGTLTVVALQVSQRRPLLQLLRLPLKVMVAGFFGVAVYTVVIALAFGMADNRDIGQVGLLNYLWPIWTVLLASVLLEEKPKTIPTVMGALLGFAGVVMARGTETFMRPPSALLPHSMALGGGFLWALYCVLLKRWRIPEEQGGTAFHFGVCALIAAVLATIRGEWTGCVFTPEAVFWVLFGGVGPVGLGYYWWEIGIKRGNVHLISLMAYFIPIGAAVLIGLFFKESLSWGLIPGAGMIAAGAWLVRRATNDAQTQG